MTWPITHISHTTFNFIENTKQIIQYFLIHSNPEEKEPTNLYIDILSTTKKEINA
jgi:hypothetical protein